MTMDEILELLVEESQRDRPKHEQVLLAKTVNTMDLWLLSYTD